MSEGYSANDVVMGALLQRSLPLIVPGQPSFLPQPPVRSDEVLESEVFNKTQLLAAIGAVEYGSFYHIKLCRENGKVTHYFFDARRGLVSGFRRGWEYTEQRLAGIRKRIRQTPAEAFR